MIDERLLDGEPMRPVECRRCRARVLVRKASWEQTSVQWDAAAMAACEERRAAGPFAGCPALRESIARAALEGVLPVLDPGGAE